MLVNAVSGPAPIEVMAKIRLILEAAGSSPLLRLSACVVLAGISAVLLACI